MFNLEYILYIAVAIRRVIFLLFLLRSEIFPYPLLFLSISCTIGVILLNITNVFQIWSTLIAYEELTRAFKSIGN